MASRTPSVDAGVRTSGITQSIWLDGMAPLGFSPLENDIHVDVAIIGGGILGITAAYCLSQEGKKVAVLEDGHLVSGETGRTTGHLTYALDDRYFYIQKHHGTQKARLAWKSHRAAIEFIESAIKKHGIRCDFERVDGYVVKGPKDGAKMLEQELEALHSIGCDEVELVDESPIRIGPGPALRFPNQAQFHVLKYLQGLARAIGEKKGMIFTQTHVSELLEGRVKTSAGHTVFAKETVIATNAPIKDTSLSLKQGAYRTYAIAAKIRKGSVPKALCYDTNEEGDLVHAYHYVRVHDDGRHEWVIVGGEDHKVGQINDGKKRFARLEQWARKRFPISSVDYRWSGQVLEPVDGVAFIGKYPGKENVYVGSGDSGNGLTHATIAGMLITDLILGRKNPWQELYSPSRIAKDIRAFLRENVNVAKVYVQGKMGQSAHHLDMGEGMVIDRGKEKIAVFKDDKGKVNEYTAVCPHLKCIVKWNSLERSFDCPCHGSRFGCRGELLMGPANRGLDPIEPEKENGYAGE